MNRIKSPKRTHYEVDVMKKLIKILLLSLSFVNCHFVFADVLNPDNADIARERQNFGSGYYAYQSDDWQSALSFLEKVSAQYILYDYAVYYTASALSKENRYDEAVFYFNKILKEYPDSPLLPYVILNLGNIFMTTGNYEKSREYFNMFVRTFPSHSEMPDALYNLAVSLEKNGLNEESQQLLKRLYIDYPMSKYTKTIPEPVLSKDELYNRLQNLFNAREYRMVIKEATPEKDARFLLISAKSFYYTKDYNEAMRFFKIVSDSTGSNFREEASLWLGKTYSNLRQNEDAVKIYNEYMGTFPNGIYIDEITYRTAVLLAESDGDNRALELLNKLANKYPSSKLKYDALWQMAWIHYQKGNYKEAEIYLKLLEKSPLDRLKKRAVYWQGKILLKQGSNDSAADTFKKLLPNTQKTETISTASLLPSYYEVLARKSLIEMGINLSKTQLQARTYDFMLNSQNMHIKKAEELLSMDIKKDAYMELGLLGKDSDINNLIHAGIIYKNSGNFQQSSIIGHRLLHSPSLSSTAHPISILLSLAYPLGYQETVDMAAEPLEIDQFLVYAVISQESAFNETVVSRAGAIGLMQIMPNTGKTAASKLSLNSFIKDDLLQPDTNIKIGAWYLKEVLREFNGNIILALAAYNAGPHVVKSWLKKNGNSDMDEFVENIPYSETRLYVEKVLSKYETYKLLYLKDGELTGLK